ncbi:MAG: GHMP family kinase ATP-binding protein [Pseudobdellovibrio sp.]
MVKDIKNITVPNEASIIEALEKITLNNRGLIFIVDKNNVVQGLATDGDIRRGLVKGLSNHTKITEVMNRAFVSVDAKTPRENILKLLDHKIHVVPVLDEKGILKGLYTRENFPLNPDRPIYARSRAPVRISFGGGGSDLTHYFVDHKGIIINATISLYSRASLKKNFDGSILIRSEDLNCTLKAAGINELSYGEENQMGLIISLIKLINPDFGFELTIESDYPPGSGLGGSAVVLVAIIGCFNQFREDKWDHYEMAEMAFQAERLLLNLAGGWQDQYASVFGGFNFMEFDKDSNVIHPLRVKQDTILELESCLILCHTGTPHRSSEIHIDQKKQMQTKVVLDLVTQNKEISYQIKNQLLRGRLNEFAKLLDAAWALKRQFSKKITNPEIDSIYEYAKQNGALGGKLLGAGGGGYFLFYVDPFKRHHLKQALNDKGFKTQSFTFDNNGLQAWSVRNNSSDEPQP